MLKKRATGKVTEYLKVKSVLGNASLIVGVPALAFALFGWSQTAQPLFGDYIRYVCVMGSLGAMISGSLILKEKLAITKPVANQPKNPRLKFLPHLMKKNKLSLPKILY